MACVGRFIQCEIQSKFLNRPLFIAAVDGSIKRISFSIAYFSSNEFRGLAGANDRLQMCPQKGRWSKKRKIYASREHVTDNRDRHRKCGGAILRTPHIGNRSTFTRWFWLQKSHNRYNVSFWIDSNRNKVVKMIVEGNFLMRLFSMNDKYPALYIFFHFVNVKLKF